MDGGKVGRSMSTQPCDNGDGRRGPNSLPEDGAGPSREDAVDVHARRQKPTGDPSAQASDEREPAAQPEVPSGSKRRARDEHRDRPFAKINLQEFIPESQVIDYEEVDSRRLRLSCFQKGTTEEDVADLCKGAVSTGTLVKGVNLVHYHATYATPEDAVAAAQVLDGVEVKGCRVRVTYMGERWHDPGRCPPVSSNILDISNVPSEYCSKEKLQPIFKLGEVTKVSPTGTCKVVFPSSTELIKTVRDPSHHTLDGQRLKFAMGIESVLAQKLSNVIAKCAKRPTKSPPPKTSRGKSSGQNKMARKK
uniref:RNA-binding protein n=1 Tax=Rhipicephalus appendiculatus TaxID=34631 RepID=A0A131YKS2_RHIAP